MHALARTVRSWRGSISGIDASAIAKVCVSKPVGAEFPAALTMRLSYRTLGGMEQSVPTLHHRFVLGSGYIMQWVK